MARWRYFFQSMNVMNGLLLSAIAVTAYFAVVPFLDLDIRPSLPAVKRTVVSSGETAALLQNTSPVDYALISDQNLFHPERRIPPEKKEDKALAKPDVYLYGTLITDGLSMAFIEDKKTPYSTAGRGKRQLTLRKGDRFSGYILQEVEADRILLVKGDEKILVLLHDAEKRRAEAAPASPAGGSPASQPVPSSLAPPAAAKASPAGGALASPASPPSAASPAKAFTSSGAADATPSQRHMTRRERVEMVKSIAEQYRQNR